MSRGSLAVVVLLSAVMALCACGGGGGGTSSPTQPVTKPVSISVSPLSATIEAGATQRFTATVANAGNIAVSWSVQENDGGSIAANGTYTAPARTGTFHIVATSQADTSKSASATVTVTARALSFTSEAPTSASEGSQYSYTAVARDSINSPVTFEWTTVPAGASANGATITWTPSQEQSRKPNAFVVQARSSLGATAQQSWTVSPRGTVHVFANDVHHTASGALTSIFPVASNYSVSAWVGTGASAAQIAGVAQGDGSVNIPNVPAGRYWLSLGNGEWFDTDKSAIDLGMNFTGRGDGVTDIAVGPQTFNFGLTGLDAWSSGSELRYWEPNTGENGTLASSLAQRDSSSISGSEESSLALLDASAGDAAYLLQMSPYNAGGLTGQLATRFFGPLASTMTEGGTTAVSGAMQALPQALATTLAMSGSNLSAIVGAVHPGKAASDAVDIAIEVQPFVANIGADGTRPVLFHGTASLATDINATLSWSSPFPAGWKPVLSYVHPIRVTLNGPSGDATIPAEVVALTDVPAQGASFVVPVQPAKDATVDGQPFFTSTTTLTTTPTLRWTPVASAGTTVNGYTVVVTEIQSGGSTSELAWINTAQQQVTIPAGILQPGMTYVFTIRSWADAAMKIDEAPYRWGYPTAWAYTVSAPMQVAGAQSASTATSTTVAPRAVRTGTRSR